MVEMWRARRRPQIGLYRSELLSEGPTSAAMLERRSYKAPRRRQLGGLMSHSNARWLYVVLAVFTALLPLRASLAQELEEIVVTARKQNESLQEAPVAVTAFTAETIESLGLANINDIARFSPGVTFQAAFGRGTERPVIRGASSIIASVNPTAESGAAYFVDGIYYAGAISGFDIREVERVEVIKGPQSALYGRNTYSGAINFITKGPAEEFDASFLLAGGQHDEYRASASVSGPLVGEVLSGRVSARYYEYGGEYRNTVTGDYVGDEKSTTFSGVLYFSPHDDLDVRLRASYQEDDDGALPLFMIGADANNCYPGLRSPRFYGFGSNENQYFCGVVPPRNFVSLNSGPSSDGVLPDGTAYDGTLNKLSFATLAVDWDMFGSGYRLVSQTGLSRALGKFGSDSDFRGTIFVNAAAMAPNNAWFANTNFDDTDDVSQELRVESPADKRVRWMVGGYYFKRDAIRYTLQIGRADRDVFNRDVQTVNTSVFGLIGADIIPDRLSVTVEGRWMDENKSRFEANIYEEGEYDGFTPRVTLDYKFSPDMMVYGIYSEGLKPGGLNGAAGRAAGIATFEQESSKNYEIGFKSTWLGGKLTANIAAYFVDAQDVQLGTSVANTTGNAAQAVTTNQGAAETKGIEFELQARPIKGLSLGLIAAHVEPEFTQGCDADLYVLRSGGFVLPLPARRTAADLALCDISGLPLPLTAENQFAANVAWSAPLGAREISYFVNADATYESSKSGQIYDADQTGSATLFGMQLGLRADNWKVTLYGRNLFDEDSVVANTRFFDISRGSIPFNNPLGGTPNATRPPATVGGRAVDNVTSGPWSNFTTLRRGRSVGLELQYEF
jgi:iron complex outermembrane recepter protein